MVYFTTVGEAELRHSVAMLRTGKRRTAGRTISQFDRQIAAAARANEAADATRNTGDFEGCGIDLINPSRFTTNR